MTQVYVTLQQFCEKDDRPRQVLKAAGFDVIENKLGRRLKREELPDLLKNSDAVIAGVEPYDRPLFDLLPKLRCLSRCGIGTDAIDLVAAKDKNISVLVTMDEVIDPVAEMTLAMILGLARNFQHHVTDARAGAWKKHSGFLIRDWTIGLVGFGRIGRAVARLLRPFGAHLLVFDPAVVPAALPEGVVKTDFDSLLQGSDVVSLHAARNPEDGPLIGVTELAQMKQGSYLVNTARGYLVDEPALLKALESGKLAGAALDVYENEPYTGPLFKLPQVLSTPHVATLTESSRAAMELRAAENIVAFFKERGRSPLQSL